MNRHKLTRPDLMATNDFLRARKVIGGPYQLFDGSFIGEFLEPDELDATFLIRITCPAKHPLLALEKRHPVVPPLHLHYDQSETFKVIKGKWGVATGWEQKDTILTATDGAFEVTPMLPHTPWPVACDEDTIVYAWGHPTGTPKPLSTDFFRQIFFYTQDLFEAKKSPDLLQLMLMQHETNSTAVILPSFTFLGSLRWLVPWYMQGAAAALARLLGYSKDMPQYLKRE